MCKQLCLSCRPWQEISDHISLKRSLRNTTPRTHRTLKCFNVFHTGLTSDISPPLLRSQSPEAHWGIACPPCGNRGRALVHCAPAAAPRPRRSAWGQCGAGPGALAPHPLLAARGPRGTEAIASLAVRGGGPDSRDCRPPGAVADGTRVSPCAPPRCWH